MESQGLLLSGMKRCCEQLQRNYNILTFYRITIDKYSQLS